MREPFPATRWTLLARAREPGVPGRLAREEFAQTYYRPIFAFIRAIVQDTDVAEDLTQEFFVRLSREGAIFHQAAQDKGSFRGFLMTALRNHVTDYHRRRARRDVNVTHPDQWDDDGWNRIGSPAFRTAEDEFHRAWVETTLQEALATVRQICHTKRKDLNFALFEEWFQRLQEGVLPDWKALAEPHHLTPKQAEELADTAKRHFRRALRHKVRQQLAWPPGAGPKRAQLTEAAVDRELEAFLSPIQE